MSKVCKTVPFHISPLRPSQSENTVLNEDIQRERINTFLVDYNKTLGLRFRLSRFVNSLVANKLLQLHDFLKLRVQKATFRFYELFPLLCG